MSETPKQQTPDITQLWRDWLTQSERQVNASLAQALNQEGSARTITGYMEVYAAFQRMLAEGMQQYLSFFNVPSRTDVLGLGDTLRGIEERLSRIEETLRIAAEALDEYERGQTPRPEPLRTRRPPMLRPPEELPVQVPAYREHHAEEAPAFGHAPGAEAPAASEERVIEMPAFREVARSETPAVAEQPRFEAPPRPGDLNAQGPSIPEELRR